MEFDVTKVQQGRVSPEPETQDAENVNCAKKESSPSESPLQRLESGAVISSELDSRDKHDSIPDETPTSEVNSHADTFVPDVTVSEDAISYAKDSNQPLEQLHKTVHNSDAPEAAISVTIEADEKLGEGTSEQETCLKVSDSTTNQLEGRKTELQLTPKNQHVSLDRVSLNSFDSESSAALSSEQSEQHQGRFGIDFVRSQTSRDSSDEDSLISELESELESQLGAYEVQWVGKDPRNHERGAFNHSGKRCGTRDGKMPKEYYKIQIDVLQQTIQQHQKEAAELREKLATNETEFRKVLATTRAESTSKIDKLTHQFESAKREKEATVVRYAQSEKEVITLKKTREELDRKLRDSVKEKESLSTKLRVLHADRVRICSSLDAKLAELSTLQREHEKVREELGGRDIKIKWAQNKLMAEMDSHKETQIKLEQTLKRLKETREESEQVRKDCQEMIRRYQEAEEIKSVSLDLQLRAKLSELEVQKQEKTDQEEVYEMIRMELDSLKKKHKLSIDENNSLTVKIHSLEKERLEYEQTVSKMKDVQNGLRQEIVDLNSRLSEMENLEMQLNREREKVMAAQREAERVRQSNMELQCDMDACHLKEGELLEFTERLTAKSVHLQSEHSLLEVKAQNVEEELVRLNKKLNEMDGLNIHLKSELAEEKHHRQEETQLLARKLAEKTKSMDNLTTKLEESENENRVMKRRHIASIRELSRELYHAKRRLDAFENNHCPMPAGEVTSLGSRASSTGSLDKMNNHCANGPSIPPSVTFASHRRSFSSVSVQTKDQENENSPSVSSSSPTIDRQMLIERIVRLQRSLARKNDKIEFLEEHIRQLLAEIKKKSRIIQNYILREEAGALSPNMMDQNKIDLSKKGGIMASVYSSQCSDSHLTLELSLEINQKLQAVLEDTLLKNITLKENINTLGEEIARITKDHRELLIQSQRRRSVK